MQQGYHHYGGRRAKNKHRGPAQKKKTVTSYGVVLVRRAAEGMEAVIVRGRYSYGFSEFVLGKYGRRETGTIQRLFAGMTVDERLDVLSLNFAQMWYRVWLSHHNFDLFERKKKKFVDLWIAPDGGVRLASLVQAAPPVPPRGGLPYSFPKGRQAGPREAGVACAVRETGEEAGVAKSRYRVLPGFRRKVAYTGTNGIRYAAFYYAGLAAGGADLRLGVDLRRLTQAAEVSEVRWMRLEEIRLVDGPDKRLEKTAAAAFSYVKNYLKGRPRPARCGLFGELFEARGSFAKRAPLDERQAGASSYRRGRPPPGGVKPAR